MKEVSELLYTAQKFPQENKLKVHTSFSQQCPARLGFGASQMFFGWLLFFVLGWWVWVFLL